MSPSRPTRSLALVALFAFMSPFIVEAAAPAPAGELEGLLNQARGLHREGLLEEALEIYLEVAASASSAESGFAAIARNNACVVLMNRGRYREAVTECRSALELRRELDDDSRTARTLNNLGLALQSHGLLEEAEERFLEARDINRALGEVRAEVVNEANLGVLHTVKGSYERALAHHGTAARLARDSPDTDWAAQQVRIALINRGVVLEKLGAYRDALDLYLEVLVDEDELEAWQMAPLLVNKGVIYRNLGDPVQALADFGRARGLFDRIGDLSGLSNTWLNEALALHLNLERPAQAEESYRRALALARESGDISEEIQDLFYLGALLRETGRLGEAAEIFEACLEASRAADSAEGRWSSLEGLGRVAWAQNRTGQALDYLLAALDEIEQARSGLTIGRLRSGFFGDRRSAYAATVELLALMHRHDPGQGHAATAFLVAQRAKARDLLDVLGDRGAPLAPLSAAEVGRHLADEVLLEYFVADTVVLRWEIHQDDLKLAEIGAREPLGRAVGNFHDALAHGDEPRASLAHFLSRSLLGGLSSPALKSDKLRIASDGRLRYLPFELLPDPADQARTLVDRVVLAYLPSGSALGRPPRSRREPVLLLAGLGNPQLDTAPMGLYSAAAATARRHGLGALPAAERELAAAAAALAGPAEILTGSAATEEAFHRLAGEGSQVVHLATHAVLDERSENGAAILLRPTDTEDGLLFPAEVAALEMESRLVVLSACRSALGGPEDGRALASLTGAFLAAGSDAVLATLWDVGDETAAVMSEQLYYELARGRAPARALTEVKRRMRTDPAWSHPSLWGAWVLIGSGDQPITRTGWIGRFLAYPDPVGVAVLVGAAILLLAAAAFALSRLRSRAGPS